MFRPVGNTVRGESRSSRLRSNTYASLFSAIDEAAALKHQNSTTSANSISENHGRDPGLRNRIFAFALQIVLESIECTNCSCSRCKGIRRLTIVLRWSDGASQRNSASAVSRAIGFNTQRRRYAHGNHWSLRQRPPIVIPSEESRSSRT